MLEIQFGIKIDKSMITVRRQSKVLTAVATGPIKQEQLDGESGASGGKSAGTA